MTKTEIIEGLRLNLLVPRFHAGVGMMQLYLTDSVRLHVFDPDMPARPEAFGNRHNHRFDMESTVLHGAIIDKQFNLETAFWTGNFQRYSVIPAHLYTGNEVPERADDILYNMVVRKITRINAGETYTMPAGAYHETSAVGLTVTLMTKTNQVETHATIVGYREQIVEHAMKVQPSQLEMEWAFMQALDKLTLKEWLLIEEATGE